MPLVEVTDESRAGYGHLVDDPNACEVEVVRRPIQGTRPIDADTGDQGGTTQGVFTRQTKGDILFGRNEAVPTAATSSATGRPENAKTDHVEAPSRILLWHANYRPDGASFSFASTSGLSTFYVPLGPPGNDIRPEHFVCFRFDGSRGPYIHPNIWYRGSLLPERKPALLRQAGRNACAGVRRRRT